VARALWHLELGYDEFEPMGTDSADRFLDDDFDYDEDELACTHCGGEGWGPVDDPLWDECDEFGYGPCASCRGTGERRQQWVF
jgi:hypothetical protein